MKIIINYDFFEKILDARENLNILKVVRNNNKKYAFFYLPAILSYDLVTGKDIKTSLLSLPIAYLVFSCLDLMKQKMIKADQYQEEAVDKLKKLVPLLNGLGIDTDYDLLLKSNIYGKVNNLYLNENKLPEIMTSKYILVPSYNHSKDIKNTSIVQEHVIGTHDYVLSIGSLKKERKVAYSNI